MEDLEHILPDQIRRNISGRKILLALLVVLGVFVVLTITLGGLLAHKHVETSKQGASNAAGGGAGSPSAQTSQGDKKGPGSCVTPSCLQAAAWSLMNMDRSVKPCDNFYQYACGGWEKNKVIPPDWRFYTVLSELYHENEEKLREIIQSPIRRNGIKSTERKLKDFFQSCLHDYGRMREGAAVMMDIIKNKLGGWYALDPDNWQADQWDITSALTTALADYLINAFFTVRVATDLRNYSRNAITLYNGGLGMAVSYYHDDDRTHLQQAYKDYIKDTGRMLLRDGGANLTSEQEERALQQFVDDAYFQESHIAKGVLENRRNSNYYRRFCTTIREFSANYTQINWFAIIKEYFGDDVTQDTEVCVRRKGFFDLVDRILRNETDNKNRIMNNYLVWSFVDTYGRHLSWDYKYTGLKFNEIYSSRPIQVAPTWEQCLTTTEYRLGSALAAEFLASHIGQGGKQEVEGMFQSVKQSLLEQLDDVEWMDNITKIRAREKLSNLNSMVGFPDSYFNDTFLDNLHKDLVVNKSAGYFANLLSVNAFRKKMWQLELKAGRQLSVWRYFLQGGGFGLYTRYLWSLNKVVVPAGLMQFPMFNRHRPKYMGYGGLGSLVGEEVFATINDRGRYLWSNGSFWVWWTTYSYAEYLKQRACFTSYLANQVSGPYLVDGENITIPISTYAARSIMNDYVGIKLAYTTYMNKFKGTDDDTTPPGLGLTSEQAFFLSTAQIKCAKRRDSHAYSRVRAGYTPDDFGVNVALGHMQEFNDAFKCSAEDPMNLKEKCHYWPSASTKKNA